MVKAFGIISITLLLSGCATGGEKQTVGTIIGGGAGALIGSQFGGGAGQIVGTAVGAVGGALAGGMIGKNMDENDRRR